MANEQGAGMRVLLASDGSEGSAAAIREIGRRPWPEGSELRLIVVDPPLGEPMHAQGPTAYDAFVLAQRAEAERWLREGEALLRSLAPGVMISSALIEGGATLLGGSAADAIIREAAAWGADLIAIGSRGRSALKSILLGSVSMEVVLKAPCSVEVVRPRVAEGA